MNEREVERLLTAAEALVEADNLKEAGEKIHQALQIAKKMEDEKLVNQIMRFIQGFTYSVETQSIKLNPIEAS
ncbi:MAG: hypothetical protein JSW53_03545, partial [Candidatus Bathyarchaeota archaeon]